MRVSKTKRTLGKAHEYTAVLYPAKPFQIQFQLWFWTQNLSLMHTHRPSVGSEEAIQDTLSSRKNLACSLQLCGLAFIFVPFKFCLAWYHASPSGGNKQACAHYQSRTLTEHAVRHSVAEKHHCWPTGRDVAIKAIWLYHSHSWPIDWYGVPRMTTNAFKIIYWKNNQNTHLRKLPDW